MPEINVCVIRGYALGAIDVPQGVLAPLPVFQARSQGATTSMEVSFSRECFYTASSDEKEKDERKKERIGRKKERKRERKREKTQKGRQKD